MAAMNRSTHSNSGSSRGFWSLIVTQFQGAFSDNVVKNLVVFVALFGTTMTLAEKNSYGEWIAALFALPFILFSMAGGFLADRFSKRSVMLGVKVFELLHHGAGVRRSLVLEQISPARQRVFLMGTHSAIFGPSKYGSLPELLPEKKLSWGNGILELGTFMAIILGTVAAALMSAGSFRGAQWKSGVILLALAVMRILPRASASRKIPAADPGSKSSTPISPPNSGGTPPRCGATARSGSRSCGNTYFNFSGMLLLLNLFFYGSETLGVTERAHRLFSMSRSRSASAWAAWRRVISPVAKSNTAWCRSARSGFRIFSAWLAAPDLSVTLGGIVRAPRAAWDFQAAFSSCPSPRCCNTGRRATHKGQVQATANWLSFVGVFLASGAHWLLAQKLALSPRGIFLVGGVLTLARRGLRLVSAARRAAALRFCGASPIRSIKSASSGRDHIPAKGGALFVCNHLSFADALLLIALDRPAHPLPDVQGQVTKAAGSDRSPKFWAPFPFPPPSARGNCSIRCRWRREAIRNGEVVCIFAEGQITRLGQLLPFQRGFERIMKDVDAPIIPVALDGVLGSPTSFVHGRMVRRFPRPPPAPGHGQLRRAAAASAASHIEVREAVQALIADAWQFRRDRMEPMPAQFHPRRPPSSAPVRDGRCDAVAKSRSAAALVKTVFLAQPPEKSLARPEHGRAAVCRPACRVRWSITPRSFAARCR